ncbi:MAG: amidohydrolase family protein [Acidobacteria bacterium]|nr:amidohydrolase family protein [Acidobacteriota bacterium]
MKANRLPAPYEAVVKWSLILAVCAFAVQAGPAVLAQQSVTAIQGGTLIDGNGGAPLTNALIVIEGNRIRSISQGGTPPAGARVIDARGKYITPGLWDTHTHYRNWFPELLITNGVTSVLAYGGGPWLNAQMEGINNGHIYGPRFFLSQGTIGGIYMGNINMVHDPEEAMRQVDALADRGSKIIKVYTSVTPQVLAAITRRAHQRGLFVSGHIGMGAKEAALAGIDNLAHATGLPVPDMLKPEDLAKIPDMRIFDTGRLRVAFPESGRPWNSKTELWGPNPDFNEYPLAIEDPRRIMSFGLMDRDLTRDLIDLLVREEVFIESCIGYMFRQVNDHMEEWRAEDLKLFNDPNLHYIPERFRMNILDYTIMDQFTPDELALMKQGYENYLWFTKTFVDAGGKISTGMDTTSPYHATMFPGLGVRREMQILVDAGLTNMQAIQAATLWAAELLQQDEDLGTLEAGKLADLLILDQDPLQDITAFKNIGTVMKDGKEMQTGYHYDFTNPIPTRWEYALTFGDWVISELPTHITSISPSVVTEDSDDFTLTVRGEEFVSSSIILFEDTRLRTEMVSSTELRATVPANLVRSVGTTLVRVVHRAPAWGKTNSKEFYVKFR